MPAAASAWLCEDNHVEYHGGLIESANALSAFDQVLQVTQNNVASASTPGFAKQSLQLTAEPFQPPGLLGGVVAGTIQSSRDEFAEQAVRQQTIVLGQQQQLATSLTSLQSVMDVSGNTGIPYALNNFFQSVSAWSQTPSDQAARQTVIARAGDVAQAIRDASAALEQVGQDTDTQTRSTVNLLNQLVAQIQAYNHQILQTGSGSDDSGMDASVHATLEQLSSLVDFTATQQSDGTTTILLNGSTPLLVGDKQYALSTALTSTPSPPALYADAPPHAQLLAGDRTDVTAQTTGGQLGALLNVRNTILPTFQGDANEVGSLNTLAQSFADRVNQLFTSGNISDGPPPQPGVPLFTYDTSSPVRTAATLNLGCGYQ